jgi:hypothetical protein
MAAEIYRSPDNTTSTRTGWTGWITFVLTMINDDRVGREQ